MITSGHIRAALVASWGSDHAILFEVGNGTGHGTRRHIDAIAMGLWPSRGLEVHGIEIKISRGDWKRELQQPEKADEIHRYCNRWWVAAPKGLVPVAELPEGWGLLECEAGAIRIKHQAAKLEPLPLTRQFVAACLRRASQADRDHVNAAVEQAMKTLEADMKRRYEAQRSRDADKAAEVLEKAKAVKEATGIDLLGWTPSADIVAAIQFVTSSGLVSRYGELASVRQSAEHLIRRIDAALPPKADA